MTTISHYIQQNIGGQIIALPNVWIRLRNNFTSVDYVSTTATDANGLFTVNNVPAGSYTVYTGPASNTTPTPLGDNNFTVEPTDSANLTTLPGALTVAGATTFTAGPVTLAPDTRDSTQAVTEAVLVSGVNAALGKVVAVTLTANRVVGLPLNPAVGQELQFIITQGGAGSYTLTWPAGIKTAWQPAPAAGAISSLTIRYYGTNWQQVAGQVAVSDAGILVHQGPMVGQSLTVTSGPYTPFLADGVTPTPPGIAYGKVWDYGGEVWNVKARGAKGDGQVISNAVATNGSAIITSVSNPFAAADVGKNILVRGAGGTNVDLLTTIASYQSANQVTLTVAATVGGTVTAYWATDDTPAIRAVVNAVIAAGGGIVDFPQGNYWVSSQIALSNLVSFQGVSRGQSGPTAQTKAISAVWCAAGSAFAQNTVFNKGVVFPVSVNLATNTSTLTANHERGGWVKDMFFLQLQDLQLNNVANDLCCFNVGCNMGFANVQWGNWWSFLYGSLGYVDQITVDSVYGYTPHGTGDQIHLGQLGDATRLSNLSFDAPAFIGGHHIYLWQCRGGEISDVIVATIYLLQCEAVTIHNAHQEAKATITFDTCKGCKLDTSVVYRTRVDQPQVLFTWNGDDYSRSNPNVLDNVLFRYIANSDGSPSGFLNTGTGTSTSTDATHLNDTSQNWQPGVWVGGTAYSGGSTGNITANTATGITVGAWTGGTPTSGLPYTIPPYNMDVRVHSNSQIEFRNCSRFFNFNLADPTRAMATGILIEDETLTPVTAFNQRTARFSYRSTWEQATLRYNYEMEAPGPSINNYNAPQATGMALPAWQLATAMYFYQYDFIYDVARNIGVNNSTEGSVAMVRGGNCAQLLPIGIHPTGIVRRIWRGTASGVYTAYADIPFLGGNHIFDDGVRVLGIPWVTAGLPSRNLTNMAFKVGNAGRYELFGTAAPVNGTWALGDIVWNTAPPAGGIQCWVCTAAGSPGTWTAAILLNTPGGLTLTGYTSITVGGISLSVNNASPGIVGVGNVQFTGSMTVSGAIESGNQLYPGAEAGGLQVLGGLLHSTGVPSNANGNNNDWCISDNGHIYFKAAAAWSQKI